MKSLVTGAAGFIGSHVVRALIANGDDVRALVLPKDDARNLRGLDVEKVVGDVTDRASVARAVAGCHRVFHLAAVYALWERTPGVMHRVNVEGTRTVLEEARKAGVARVIYTSSIARFGGQGGRGGARQATEASAFRLGATGDVYSQTKNDAHEVALAAAKDMDVTIVAPTGPIGPGDVGPTPTGRLLVRCLSLPVVTVVPTMVNFADVRDMAQAHLLAAENGARGETYLVGGRDRALADLARRALAIAGISRRVVEVPLPVARLAGHAALAVADHLTHRQPLLTPAAVSIAKLGLAADCSKAARELGMTCRPIDESLRDALAWFAREGYLRDRRLERRLALVPSAT